MQNILKRIQNNWFLIQTGLQNISREDAPKMHIIIRFQLRDLILETMLQCSFYTLKLMEVQVFYNVNYTYFALDLHKLKLSFVAHGAEINYILMYYNASCIK